MEKPEKEVETKDIEDIPPMKISWRHLILLPALFLMMFGGVLNGFVIGEWTQKVIRNKYFPNNTESFSVCGKMNSSETEDEMLRKVQQEAARWGIYFSLADSIPVTIVTMILPSYTDSLGRKFLIVLTTTGSTAKAIISTLVVYFEGSFWYLFASNIVFGFTGSIFSLFSAMFAMVADLTHGENQRTLGIIVVDCILLLAGVVGSYCSGLFVETLELNFFYTAVIGTSMNIVAYLLLLILKESHPPHKRSKKQSVFYTVKRITDFYVSSEFKGQRTAYLLLLFAFGAATVAGINRGGMETLYFLGKPFCWGPSKIGMFSMARNAAQAVIGLGSVRILQMCFSNAMIGIISTFSNAVSYVVEAFATSTLMIYMVPVTGMFSFLVIPMIRSLMSAITPVDKQGAAFASVAIIEVICTMAASMSQNIIYSATMSFMNGFVFLICAIISMVNMVLMMAYWRVQKSMNKEEVTIETPDIKPTAMEEDFK